MDTSLGHNAIIINTSRDLWKIHSLWYLVFKSTNWRSELACRSTIGLSWYSIGPACDMYYFTIIQDTFCKSQWDPHFKVSLYWFIYRGSTPVLPSHAILLLHTVTSHCGLRIATDLTRTRYTLRNWGWWQCILLPRPKPHCVTYSSSSNKVQNCWSSPAPCS